MLNPTCLLYANMFRVTTMSLERGGLNAKTTSFYNVAEVQQHIYEYMHDDKRMDDWQLHYLCFGSHVTVCCILMAAHTRQYMLIQWHLTCG